MGRRHPPAVVVQSLLLAFWLFIPAYAANPLAVVWGGGASVDLGRRWSDGRRIFGDGKTWRGFFGGGLSALVIGIIQWPSSLLWSEALSLDSFLSWIGPVAALAFGALLGDLLGSFIKRRLGIQRGRKAPVLDQYDFVLGAFLLTGAIFPGWALAHYILNEALFGLILIIVITPILHRVVNIIGYKIGKKEVPW